MNKEHKDDLWTAKWYCDQIQANPKKAVTLSQQLEDFTLKRLGVEKIQENDRPDRENMGDHGLEDPQTAPNGPIRDDGFEFSVVDIDVSPRGEYLTPSSNPYGAVIHFTAGRYEGEAAAIGTLKWLGKSGLGCFVLSQSGKMYRAKNQAYNQRDSHAGVSRWQGKSSVSNYCAGIETACAGRLTKYKGEWYPWYAWSKGRFTGKVGPIPASQIRSGPTSGNRLEGHYQKFTPEQEDTILRYTKWAITYKGAMVDWFMGHDECAGDMTWANGKYGQSGLGYWRKNDPGYSFSLSMEQFRDLIRKDLGL